ncbi:MAG: YndJ family transporter [Saprospiraceae bacterium]
MLIRITPILSWVIFVVYAYNDISENRWELCLVLFAALSIVPKGMWLIGHERPWWYWVLVAGLYLGFWYYPSEASVWLAMPYLCYAAWFALWEISNLVVYKIYKLERWVRAAAYAYWAVGAAWAVLFLADASPFGFSPTIVGLTSAHFHYAGFVLAVLVLCMLEDMRCVFTEILGVGILVGMPIVAAGITFTKLGYSPIYESVFASLFVLLVLGITGHLIYLIFQKRHLRDARKLWVVAAGAMLFSMAMAGTYALRSFWPDHEWTYIPKMITWHGTINATLFSWLILRSWTYVKRWQMDEYRKDWKLFDPDDPLRYY